MGTIESPEWGSAPECTQNNTALSIDNVLKGLAWHFRTTRLGHLTVFFPKIGAMGAQLRNVLRAVGAFLLSIAVIVLIDFTLQALQMYS